MFTRYLTSLPYGRTDTMTLVQTKELLIRMLSTHADERNAPFALTIRRHVIIEN